MCIIWFRGRINYGPLRKRVDPCKRLYLSMIRSLHAAVLTRTFDINLADLTNTMVYKIPRKIPLIYFKEVPIPYCHLILDDI